MDRFLEDIRSPYWWVSIFAVGVVINLGTAYAKPVIDGAAMAAWAAFNARMSAASSWWRQRALLRRSEEEEEALDCAEDPTEHIRLMMDIVDKNATFNHLTMLAMVCFLGAVLTTSVEEDVVERLGAWRYVVVYGPSMFIEALAFRLVPRIRSARRVLERTDELREAMRDKALPPPP